LNSKNVQIYEIAARLDAEISGNASVPILDVTHDSRLAGPGTLFAAIKGSTADGHRFIADVMRRGAAGIISENDAPADFEGVWLKVPDARRALAHAAASIYGDPSRELDLIGITGTNGKTTTTYLCFAIAEASGNPAAMLTTVEYRIGPNSEPAVRTTPEASDTNKFLRRAVDGGCTVAVMEASSQAIDLHRVDGLRFRVDIFTNLTRDHLDYHGTMDNYFAAKRKLFDGSLGERPATSVINIDDERGVRLTEDLRGEGQKVVTFSQDGAADVTATDVEVSLIRGTSFRLSTPLGEVAIDSPLVGRPHVYNMLAAAASSIELGSSLETIRTALSKCVGAPGRFERVPHDGDFAVVVDYAHTDDALLNVLQTARKLSPGRLITVFGCGGDRDRTKRMPMGDIAAKYSDHVIITSDNPRNEDPLKIIREIEEGVKGTNNAYESIPDRRDAIFRAIGLAKSNDLVMIAGKGHETYQIVGAEKYHFDDREVAREALERKSAEN
jgi:UDP-N-acetylmuramoyl-L-alanyl-D-glutamate--2,6-diaminopimelate ligase